MKYHYVPQFYLKNFSIPNILVKDDDAVADVAEFINKFVEENYKDVNGNFIISFFKKLFNIK